MALLPRAIGAGLLLAATPLALAAPAQADPGGDTFPLSCADGSTYTMVTAGNGDFTPAHDADSTTMFIPTGFGEFHGVVTNAETGEFITEFTDPPGMKGNSGKHPRATMTTCTFVFSGDEYDPDLGIAIHFEGGGSVTGFSTPAR